MICPSEDTLLELELGELPHRETLELSEHTAHCTRCRALLAEQRGLLADLAASPPLTQTEADFTAAVLERCAAPSAAVRPAARSRAPLYAALAVAAAACLWLVRPAPPTEHFAARGGKHDALDAVRVDAKLVRDGALLPLSGATLHAGDGITARYFKRAAEPEYLALFALDAQGTVHWIFPAYLDPAQDPRSIPLEASDTGRLLADAVEPEAPAPGELRVVAVISEQPLSVHDVEQRLAQRKSALSELFPLCHVQEWNTTWAAR